MASNGTTSTAPCNGNVVPRPIRQSGSLPSPPIGSKNPYSYRYLGKNPKKNKQTKKNTKKNNVFQTCLEIIVFFCFFVFFGLFVFLFFLFFFGFLVFNVYTV